MATDNRNEQPAGGQPQQAPQAGQTGETRSGAAADENPQQGDQWDNYQTRSLSSEGGEKIEESDLLGADEASKQTPEHRG